MGISVDDLADLLATTLEDLPKMTFEAPQKYQDYPMVETILRNGVGLGSGYQIKRNWAKGETGNASHVRAYQTTEIHVDDRQLQITCPWARAQVYWTIETGEALMNRQPAAFVDLLTSRRQDAMMDLVNKIEEALWQTLASSDDDLNPRGLAYWISPGNDGQDGFEGTHTHDRDGNEIASVAGLNAETYARWANYYKDYAGPTAADAMVKAMHKVYRNIRFKAPRTVKDLDQGTLANFKIFMDGDTIDAYEEYTRKSNDEIGFDVGKFAGATAFSRTPLLWVPQLDTYADSTITGDNPIYFVNMNKFKAYKMRGMDLVESPPFKDREQHNVVTTFVDIMYALMCTERRSQGLISTISG